MITIISGNTLNFKEVRTVWHALLMRKLRNECRMYMTHDTREIGVWQQVAWFKVYRLWRRSGKAKAYLVYCFSDHVYKPIGYGLIRKENGLSVLSGGLSEKYRGMGLGEQLFGFLLAQAGKAFLDVREDNVPAIRLYKKLGFKEVKRKDGIIDMIYE